MADPNYTTKERTLWGTSSTLRRTSNKWKTETVSPGGKIAVGRQRTVSRGNRRDPDGKYRSGGSFNTSRMETKKPTIFYEEYGLKGTLDENKAVKAHLHTPIRTVHIPSDMPAFDSFDSDDLGTNEKGATMIAQCAPTNSNADLAVALGEIIKEKRLPSIPGVHTWKNRTKLAKFAGSEYLNVQFGWLPLVDEITAVRDSVRHGSAMLHQYRRDAGKSVRREFALPTEHGEVETTVLGTDRAAFNNAEQTLAGPAPYVLTDPGVLVREVSTSRSYRFSGAFTYTTPHQSDSWSRMHSISAEADKLFGIDMTPDLVWELTPWSWAVDWFSNTGDVIHNVTQFATQGLVMRYGYVMCDVTRTVRYSLTGSGYRNCPPPPPSEIRMTRSFRGEANPFGFGVGWEDLSPTQLAITAALGITKLRK